MKKMIFLLLISATIAFAQTDENVYVEFYPTLGAELGFQMAIPTGEHRENNDNNGYGVGFDLLYYINKTPISGGINFGYTIFGSDTRRVPWSTTIPDVKVDVTTTNSYLFTTLFFRIQPDMKYIQPYFEGHIGFNYLETRTQVEDISKHDGDDDIASSVDLSDFGLLFGFGGGIEIPVYNNKANSEEVEKGTNFPFQVLIDLQSRYYFGGELEYLKERSKKIVDGKVEYEKIKSKTDIIAVKLGLSIKF